MKDITVYVEGETDRRLIEYFIKYVCDSNTIPIDREISEMIEMTGGWTTLNSDKSDAIRNKMKQTARRGGINLVIFDADDDPVTRRSELQTFAQKHGLSYEIFLFPNDHDPGAVEELLTQLINPDNQCVLDCWNHYEAELKKQIILWKNPKSPTTPSSKSKIYGYLEALVGTSRSEKDKIKDKKRDCSIREHWHIDRQEGKPLYDFLLKYLK